MITAYLYVAWGVQPTEAMWRAELWAEIVVVVGMYGFWVTKIVQMRQR